ncbi:MAG: pre-peptidase C-terminal domain-containing protein, partial [Gammaproteobacteria bacterium]|nr:pre-peptidase C-terminal domain-containing protein [Gammaproteobacteria bacterium]
VSSLAVFPVNVEVTALNKKLSLNVAAKDSLGRRIVGLSGLNWSSTNEAIATVNAFGEVTTHAMGNVSISASYENIADESSVTINQTGNVIDGTARYEDRIYSTNTRTGFTGFTSYIFKAIRYATIELLDENGDVFISTETDDSGAYVIGNIIPDIYTIRLLAEVKGAPASGLSVNDMRGAIYATSQSSAAGTLKYAFNLNRSRPEVGAFNLLDVATVSAEYSSQVLNADVSDLQIYWETGYGLGGTYYCTGYDASSCLNNKGIYIISEIASSFNGGVLDTDEFDDDVIMHEFGHFVIDNNSVDDSQGGSHSITQNDSDLRLSWSEGWGTFFPSAVKFWLIEQGRRELISSKLVITTYIDTIGAEAALKHDIRAGEEGDGFYYASSEAAVSRILWNVLDNFGMPKIWDVLVNYFPTSDRPTSLPVFWDGLLSSELFFSNELVTLEGIFNDRRVNYKSDASENDNTLATATVLLVDAVPNPNETSTIYSDSLAADVDYFSFTAQAGKAYKVSTTELFNGIDTAIRLFDADGNLIGANDDADPTAYLKDDPYAGAKRVRNNKTAMASAIDFTASANGQYFVEVKFADKTSFTYDFVGHYGSYKLVVAEVK